MQFVVPPPGYQVFIENLTKLRDGLPVVGDSVSIQHKMDNLLPEEEPIVLAILHYLSLMLERTNSFTPKEGFVDRVVQQVEINDNLKIHDVRIGDDFPWYILNTFVPFTAAPAYTWEEKPVELLYNTSTERTNGISVGLKAKDQIEDLLVNQLNPATQTLLYPDGFFNNLPVNQAEIAYLDWRVNEYVPVKIVVQYEANLPVPAGVNTVVKNGAIDGSVITLQAGMTSENEQYFINIV
ncbi:MAG: hypothetical protein E2O76_08965 [Caldithrix sp.]|nr:MAG: hypothetical protein E2O76_08965 [Caldithrix sp.]